VKGNRKPVTPKRRSPRGEGGVPPPKRSPINREGGFTLLEVLIAIMILVLAIAAIAPLFAVASMSHRRGVDQTEVSWLAPRIAARIQERFYDPNPKEVRGFVKMQGDGSFVIDDMNGKMPDDRDVTYAFKATFTPITAVEGKSDPMPYTCFVLKVDITYKEEGSPLAETYETVVLRKLLR
jgi:prepilin-type N-terminal cleavage/methylation domain-containing protein